VLDFLIRNRDRHDGNWVVGDDGRVIPIDHGLTFFTKDGADRDVPRSPFAKHWLGLEQKPSPYPARGKSHEDGALVKGARVRLEPKVSKGYLAEVRASLSGARDQMTDEEWGGLDMRLRMLEAAAPDSIPGEDPFTPSTPDDVVPTGDETHVDLQGFELSDRVTTPGGSITGEVIGPGNKPGTIRVQWSDGVQTNSTSDHLVRVDGVKPADQPVPPESDKPGKPSAPDVAPVGELKGGEQVMIGGKPHTVVRVGRSDPNKVLVRDARGKETWKTRDKIDGAGTVTKPDTPERFPERPPPRNQAEVVERGAEHRQAIANHPKITAIERELVEIAKVREAVREHNNEAHRRQYDVPEVGEEVKSTIRWPYRSGRITEVDVEDLNGGVTLDGETQLVRVTVTWDDGTTERRFKPGPDGHPWYKRDIPLRSAAPEYEREKKLKNKLKSERQKMLKELIDQRRGRSNEVYAVEPYGGRLSATPLDTRAVNKVREVSRMLPNDWTDRVEEVEVRHYTGRAFYRTGTISVKHHASSTALHELGHAVEARHPRLNALCREFLLKRGVGPPRRLGSHYDDDEVGWPDAFPNDPYIGKLYNHGSTEVLTMGLEGAFFNKYDFWTDKDAEYRDFILGLLLEV
jgi:hypothetical protein